VQAALNALSGSRFFSGVAERAMVLALRQVRLYFTVPEVRACVQARVAAQVGAETRVLVGHSLGSVVAYEALCAHPEWPVRALVTLGSPLGVRNLVLDRLQPSPQRDPTSRRLRGRWPGQVSAWTNIADPDDIVALVKDLRPCFDERVRCVLVDTGARAHNVTRYLTARATGQAVGEGLADG
jgi:pimeloyl-ACP methyl ester carboxylesterase